MLPVSDGKPYIAQAIVETVSDIHMHEVYRYVKYYNINTSNPALSSEKPRAFMRNPVRLCLNFPEANEVISLSVAPSLNGRDTECIRYYGLCGAISKDLL